MSQKTSITSILHLLVTCALTAAVLGLTVVVIKQSGDMTTSKTTDPTPEEAAEPAEPKLLTINDENIKPIDFQNEVTNRQGNRIERAGKLTLLGSAAQAGKDGNKKAKIDALKLNARSRLAGLRFEIGDFPNVASAGEINLRVNSADWSSAKYLIGRAKQLNGKPNRFELDSLQVDGIANKGTLALTAVWTGDGRQIESEPLPIRLDTVGPMLQNALLRSKTTTKSIVELDFSDDDFAQLEVKQFQLAFVDKSSTPSSVVTPTTVTREGRVVLLEFPKLKPGLYQVQVVHAGAHLLEDRVGNPAGGGVRGESQTKYFSVSSDPLPGRQVQFPEFLPTAKQPNSVRRANAGDRVETAVVRLFYFRDAHRVAKLINRTSRALNQAAVTLAQRRAATARNSADKLTSKRMAKEREAVRAAEQLRQKQRELGQTRQEAENLLKRLETSTDRIKELTTELQAESGRDKKLVQQELSLERERKNLLNERLALMKTNGSFQQQAQQLDALKNKADLANEAALKAQREEDLAKKEQFRRESTLGEANPDTYAAAQLRSVDPVAQVSVSVIGEGLIQLRGPRKGIDKIRTMVHQIDAPVGQVKVEVLTVQINGEKGDRMERPLGKVEAHIGLGRFLTAQSLMLLRRAINEEASRIATTEFGGHYQTDRDRRYLYAFFGRDFIDELYAMDSEFLRTQNKILSLHSMDTISLHRALFILALAKNDVRQRIMANFMSKIRSDLVQAEFDYRRSSEIFPHRTKSWLTRHDYKRISERVATRVARNAAQRYHFRSLLTFFKQLDCGVGESMNPVQREFIRLAQIFKSRMVAELALRQRIIERTLTEDERASDIHEEEAASVEVRQHVLRKASSLQTLELKTSLQFVEQITKSYEAISSALLSTQTQARELRALSEALKVRADDLTNQKNLLIYKRRQDIVEMTLEVRQLQRTINAFGDRLLKAHQGRALHKQSRKDLVDVKVAVDNIQKNLSQFLDDTPEAKRVRYRRIKSLTNAAVVSGLACLVGSMGKCCGTRPTSWPLAVTPLAY